MENKRNNKGQFTRGNTEGNRFSSENQPHNSGRKGKPVSQWLREYGEAKELEFEVIVTKTNGDQKRQKGKVESATTLNQLLAVTMINKAVSGDLKALTAYLDRTEGKPVQAIEMKQTPVKTAKYINATTS